MLFSASPRLRPGQRMAYGSLAVVLFLLFSSGLAANPPSITLDEARQHAAAHTPPLDAQAARLIAAQNDAARAGQLPDPVFSAGIDKLTGTGGAASRLGADAMTMQRIGVMQAWPSKRLRTAERGVARALATALSDRAQADRLSQSAVKSLASAGWRAASRCDARSSRLHTYGHRSWGAALTRNAHFEKLRRQCEHVDRSTAISKS